MLIMSALSNMETWNRASCDPKTQHLASLVWQCTVLLEHVKDQLSPQTRKFDRFARFCGCNCKTSKICINKPDFSPLEQGSNWQHQLRLVCLYPWHIITSSLHHDWQRIFNQLPCFVKTF